MLALYKRVWEVILNISLIFFFFFAYRISFSYSFPLPKPSTSVQGDSSIKVKLKPANKINLPLGEKKIITAQVNGTKNKGVIWNLEGEGSYRELGPNKILYKAPQSLTTPAVAIIKATSKEDESISASLEIDFPEVEVKIRSKDNSQSVMLGSTKKFYANVKWARNKDVTWCINEIWCEDKDSMIPETRRGGNEEIGFIENGLYTAPKVLSIEPIVIKAISDADPNQSDELSIKLKVSKKTPFLNLVDNAITFSNGTDPVILNIAPENISESVAKDITPETAFSGEAPPKITIKLSPIEEIPINKATISLIFKLLSRSGKKFFATLGNIKIIKKDSSPSGLKIKVPSDDISNLEDDLIDFVFLNSPGSLIGKLSGTIGNDAETGPILTNGTDTLSFDPLVFKERILEKFKDYGLSDIRFVGTFTYAIVLKGTSIAVDIGNGEYKGINSITGNITVQQ